MSNQRRIFLKVLAASPLLACTGSSGAAASFSDAAAGSTSATSIGMLALVPNAPAVLGRDDQGLYAMTITCTHEGCDCTPSGMILYCPCHGSRFNAQGVVLQGPASAPLAHFAVSIDAAGNITVHGSMQVDARVRTAIA